MTRKHRLPVPKKFIPKNESKYRGDTGHITYRSLPERIIMKFFDFNSNVIRWSSEPFPIPYDDPTAGKRRRYYPDFWVEMSDGKTLIIEYKPELQSAPPPEPTRKTAKAMERYREAYALYMKNLAKWSAAVEYAEKKGSKFAVWTERHLRVLGIAA